MVKSGEYNVAGWVQAWYSLYAQPNVRETTARYYKGYIDHHVIPRLGDTPLNKLTSLDIQQFYKDLLGNGRIREDTKAKKPGLSSTTVHGIHVMLKSALKRAVQERLIPFNPAEFCIPPKITKPELQVIPSERYQSYLTAAEQRGVLPMFYLELATGLRKGEIAALLWSDYDAQTQTIHVTKRLHALDQPDAAGSSANRRKGHAKDARALKTAIINSRLPEKSSRDSRFHLILSNQARFVPSPLASGLASMSLSGGHQPKLP